MGLTFQRVHEIFTKQFGLLYDTRQRGNYTLYRYYFEDRYVQSHKSEVAREVCELINGGVGGYIYVGHLPEFDVHPKRKKDGYLNIGDMTEKELIRVTEKVTREYK